MDPDETLKKIRARLKDLDFSSDYEDEGMIAFEVRELFEALDKWILNGGFLPKDWTLTK